MTIAAHEHQWQANGTAEVEQVSHSPVSTWDDVLYTDVLAVQTCTCGEIRKTRVGRRNIRSRGDDRRAGKA